MKPQLISQVICVIENKPNTKKEKTPPPELPQVVEISLELLINYRQQSVHALSKEDFSTIGDSRRGG